MLPAADFFMEPKLIVLVLFSQVLPVPLLHHQV